ncbi:MAG: hypothetical protein JNG88_10125 [Phycisphaerales bacterium]|nr:hypothetical protein [Phycisphaerales bacterium]
MFRRIGCGLIALAMLGSGLNAPALAQDEEGGIAAIGSAFTYQGRLRQNGNIPPDGNIAFAFRLVDSGNVVIPGTPVLNQNLFVDGGLFTTTLDFGVSPFGGDRRFLRIAVAGTTLSPNPELTPAPYSMFSAAPWVTVGAEIFYNGNVGVGNTNPQNKLHVTDNGDALAIEGTDHVYMEFFPDGYAAGRKAWIGYGTPTSDNLTISNANADAHIIMSLPGTGGLGVDTGTPEAKLHVVNGTDSEPASGGFIISGFTNAANISIDNNEIMARDNGAVSTLFLNNDGGTVYTGANLQVNGRAQIGTTEATHKAIIEHTNNNTLRLIGPGATYGFDNAINLGDAEYVYIWEDTDDDMTLFCTDGGGPAGGGQFTLDADTIQWFASKPATVKLNDGTPVKMYAEESTEVLFNDHGRGQLQNGFAHIDLDAEFLQTVTISDEHPMSVFVQLEGDCNGVFVTNKTSTGFDVRELQNGRSDAPFTYRVIANRRLYEGLRMATTEEDKAANRRSREIMWPERVVPQTKPPTNDPQPTGPRARPGSAQPAAASATELTATGAK